MIELAKNIKDANCITHSGTMHADEVFATAFLHKLLDNIKVFRTTSVNINDYDDSVLIYDIGRGKFDHHQEDREIRENNIPYCGFGLLWKEYGKKYLEKINCENIDEVFELIDKDLVEGIDAIDNGIFPKYEADYRIRNLSDIIKLFNPSFRSGEDENQQFLKAVTVAEYIFDEVVVNVIGKIKAKAIVRERIEEAKVNHYLVLDEYMPYEETVYELDENAEIYFAIFPSNRGGYTAKTIYKSPEDKTHRLPFPESWAGKESELKEVSGVADATFCHLGRFIVCSETLEGIKKLVELTINMSKEENV